MAIELSDLSPKAQQQAAAKYMAQLKADEQRKAAKDLKFEEKPNKYRSQTAEVHGIKFQSKKEARRYQELMILLKNGDIKDLKLQYEITIQPSFKTPEGETVRAIRYKADFVYMKKHKLANKTDGWFREIEDTKGFRTKEYKIKKKMLADMGIYITEI